MANIWAGRSQSARGQLAAGWIWAVSFWAAVLCLPFSAWAETGAEELLARINGLSPQARQKALVEGARKEGEVMVYFTFSSDDANGLQAAFGRRYPFIRFRGRRLAGGRMLDGILTEQRAGKRFVDVILGGSTSTGTLVREGVIGRYLSPERSAFDDRYKDEKGYWTAFFSRHLVFGYNVNLVPKERLPKSYFDFLEPFWKGKLAIDDNPASWMAGMIKAYGKEKALELFRGLVGQEVKTLRGRTLKAQLVAAGEFFGAVDQTEDSIVEMKATGAPVDYLFLENSVALTNPVSLAKEARHPHAAALLVDFLLSKEGQEAVVDIDYFPTRQGFKPKDRLLAERVAGAKLVFYDLDWFEAQQKEIGRLSKEIFRPRR